MKRRESNGSASTDLVIATTDPAAAASTGAAETPGKNLLQTLWRRRGIVGVAVAILFVFALIRAMIATPIYRSSAQIYVDQGGARVIGEEMAGIPRPNFLNTQAELMKKTAVLVIAKNTPGLEEMKTFAGTASVIESLRDGLDVSVGTKDDIITASFDSPYPDEAAAIVNAVVDAYISFNADQDQSQVADVRKLSQQYEQELESKTKQMLEFKRVYGVLSFDAGDGNIVMKRLASLSDALTAAHLETLTIKSAYEEALKAVEADPSRMAQLKEIQRSGLVLTGTQEEEIRREISILQQRLGDLKQQYLESHPIPRSYQSRIDRLNVMYVEALRQRHLAAQSREADLQRSFEEQQRQAMELNAKAAEYAKLESEVELTRKLFDDTRAKQISQANVGSLKITTLERGRVNMVPVAPRKSMIVFQGLMLGLILGVGVALLDQRFRSADEITAALKTPILGVIPAIPGRPAVKTLGKRVHLDPTSDIAEAYRTVRTAVYFGVPKGEARTLLITSPHAGDGKSTLASNVAIAMAQAGQRVLLIDADFREPTQHRIFGLNNDNGLSGVLAGRDTVEHAVQASPVKGLDIITSGPIPPNPSELLNSEVVAELLDLLIERYDQVLIDSPPVMPVTDARILAAMCDVTVMVLRAEKSTRRASQAAIDGLRAVGARIVGLVVNSAPRSRWLDLHASAYGFFTHRYGKTAESDDLQVVDTPGAAPTKLLDRAKATLPTFARR